MQFLEVRLLVSCWGSQRTDTGHTGNSLSLLLILKEKQLWESMVLPAESGEGKEKREHPGVKLAACFSQEKSSPMPRRGWSPAWAD